MISYKDKSTWLAVVWDTIQQLEVVENEYCIKQNASGAARWDDVCTAMAWIAEDLGLDASQSFDIEEQEELGL
jgi:hypothetical protein